MFDFLFSIFFAVCLIGSALCLPWQESARNPLRASKWALFPKFLTVFRVLLNPYRFFGTVDGQPPLGSFFNAAV